MQNRAVFTLYRKKISVKKFRKNFKKPLELNAGISQETNCRRKKKLRKTQDFNCSN